MAVIEPLDPGSASSARTPLPRPPPRSGDFTYAQPSDQPRDVDSTLKSWDSVPLFMKDLPTDADADTQTALDALQSLAFDGSPDEVAANFKQQANDYFRARRFREALGFYSQAIDAHPHDQALLETLHANRAACHLELHNYGSTLRDTSAVLAINAKNEKAYYRAAKALIALDRCKDAVDCCDHALGVNPDNDAIAALKLKAETRLAAVEKSQAEAKERTRRADLMAKAIQQALVVRGLWLETTPRPPDNPTPAHFDPASTPAIPLTGPESTKWSVPDVIRTPSLCQSSLCIHNTHRATLSRTFTKTHLWASISPPFSLPPLEVLYRGIRRGSTTMATWWCTQARGVSDCSSSGES